MSENLAERLIATVERYPDATALKLSTTEGDFQ